MSLYTSWDSTVSIAPERCGTLYTSAPSSGTLSVVRRVVGNFYYIDITGTLMRLAVTDAGVSGSSASQTIVTSFPAGYYEISGSYIQSAAAEGSALTTAAGDAVYIVAFGTVAANAGDGALTSTEVDILAATSNITNSGGTATATKFTLPSAALTYDGRSAAFSIIMNWSGSAATIDANSTIDLTFTAHLCLHKISV
jgi:hypothetical protein